MTADKWIQLVQWAVIAALGAALWFAKRERQAGTDEASNASAFKRIEEKVDTVAGRVGKIEQKLEDEQKLAVVEARKAGELDMWKRMIEARVDEIDHTIEAEVRMRLSGVQVGNR